MGLSNLREFDIAECLSTSFYFPGKRAGNFLDVRWLLGAFAWGSAPTKRVPVFTRAPAFKTRKKNKLKNPPLRVANFSIPGNYFCFKYGLINCFKSWEKISVGASGRRD